MKKTVFDNVTLIKVKIIPVTIFHMPIDYNCHKSLGLILREIFNKENIGDTISYPEYFVSDRS